MANFPETKTSFLLDLDGIFEKSEEQMTFVKFQFCRNSATTTKWWQIRQALHQNSRYKWWYLQIFYLFPPNYEFYKDDIIHLWDAEWLSFNISNKFSNGQNVFEEFEAMDIFQLSQIDNSTGRPRYKLKISIVDLVEKYHNGGYFRVENAESVVSDNTLHASCSSDPVIFKNLYKARRLRTLLILAEHKSQVDVIQHEFFLRLQCLMVLDLSHTNVTELPSSIGTLDHLVYLNVSWTPITALPVSVCNLYKMEILKLRGCFKLVGLPKGMRKLIRLRCLAVDVASVLFSMPPGFGDLRSLETMPVFSVSREKGCRITELKYLGNLQGMLCILKLENVFSSEEAKEAALDQKQYLDKVELHWTETQNGFDILQSLQPHQNLNELQIVGYGGPKFPSWVGDPLFRILTTVTIHDCINCELLPPLGKLPSLKFLFMSDMDGVVVIDRQFCGRNKAKAFPMLESFTLNGAAKLEKWSGIKEGDFPCLEKLHISDCSKLTTLPDLSIFKSLQQLEISHCPILESFPNEGMPVSLQDLIIIYCPLLKEKYGEDGALNGRELAHTPNVWIDYQRISKAVKNSGTSKNDTEDMISVSSNFDHRLSLDTSLLSTGDGSGSAAGGVFNTQMEEKFGEVEKIFLRWNMGTSHSLQWKESPEEAAEYLSAVEKILLLTEDLTLSRNREIMDRAQSILELAMSMLEEEFRQILIRNRIPFDAGRRYGSINRVSPSVAALTSFKSSSFSSVSFASNDGDIGEFEKFESSDEDETSSVQSYHETDEPSLENNLSVDLIHPTAVADLKELAKRMIRAGYADMCCQVYITVRRDVLYNCLSILGIEELSIEEVLRIEWRDLNGKMEKWIQAVKVVLKDLLSGEKHLCEQIFEGSDLIGEACFTETTKGGVIQLLSFGEAVAIRKHSSEELLQILDMYDALAEGLLDLQVLFPHDSGSFVCREAKSLLDALGEAAKGITYFEN